MGIYPSLGAGIEGLELAVPVYSQYMVKVESPDPDGPGRSVDEPEHIIATMPDYFNLVPHEWLAGSKEAALAAADNIILTQSRADEYFPGASVESIIGKSLVYIHWTTQYHALSREL